MSSPLPASAQSFCVHCGLPAASGQEFCCSGCRAVYSTIHKLGLEEYYKYRGIHASPELRGIPGSNDYSYLDELTPSDSFDTSITLQVEGIHCAGCMWLLEKLHSFIPGVVSSRLHFSSGSLHLRYNPAQVKLSTVAHRLDSLGYPVRALSNEDDTSLISKEEKKLLLRIGVAAFCAMNTMMLAVSLWQGFWTGIPSEYGNLLRWMSFALTVPAIFFSAWPFLATSYYSLRSRSLHIDIPIAVSLLGGFLVSTINTIAGREHVYFDSVTALITLLLTGRFLQSRALRHARSASRAAWKLLPQSTQVLNEDGTLSALPVHKVSLGMTVVSRPGERVSIDGVIITGTSGLDASLLTGESSIILKQPGDAVHAGDLVIDGEISIRTAVAGGASRVDGILRQIELAGDRSPLLTLTDKASGYFVVTILIVAVLAGIWWWTNTNFFTALDIFVAILIVTCPCALGIATPATLTVAIGKAAAGGILIRGRDTLERLSEVEAICFDKTGTLTTGRPHVLFHTLYGSHVETSEARTMAVLLSSVAAYHPVSAAILALFLDEESRTLQGAKYHPGRGISFQEGAALWRLGSVKWCTNSSPEGAAVPSSELVNEISSHQKSGCSVVLLCRNETVRGFFVLRDTLDKDAQRIVRSIVALGLTPVLLSGDAQEVVDSVAQELGISPADALGDLSPEQKAAYIAQSSKKILMVGDGFNDAYAMKVAHVGVGLRGAIDSLIEVVDVYCMKGGIGALLQLIRGAHRTIRIITLSLVISAFYNIVGAILAIAGLINPLWGAILMPISSFSVIFLALYAKTFEREV
jgi:Cu2+-exporting ATPase